MIFMLVSNIGPQQKEINANDIDKALTQNSSWIHSIQSFNWNQFDLNGLDLSFQFVLALYFHLLPYLIGMSLRHWQT